MSSYQFEKQMLDHLRRDPFEPFGAGYIGPDQIHFIESKQVLETRSLNSPASQ